MRLPFTLMRLPALVTPRITTTIAATTATARLFSTSRLAPAPASSSLTSSAGSGRGGRKDKDKAAADKLKLKAKREKERIRDRERKDRLKLKERERTLKLREKEREAAKKQKEKEKLKLQAEKAKLKVKAKRVTVVKPRTRSVLHPPKAPSNAWSVFLQRFVQERKESLPAGEKLPTVAQLTKEAAPLYSALNDGEKEPLLAEAQRQREAYPAILEAWKNSLTPEMIREENAVRSRRRKLGLGVKKAIKFADEPTRPITGYLRFAQDIRNDPTKAREVLGDETSIIEQSRLMARAWGAASAEEKEAYNQQYLAAKAAYLEEKAAFDAKHGISASSRKRLPTKTGLKVGQGEESVEEVAAQGHS